MPSLTASFLHKTSLDIKFVAKSYIYVNLLLLVDKAVYTVGINLVKCFLIIFCCGKVVKNEYSQKIVDNLV